ncbi:MAG: TetR/AcrR family transcriptional regulator [Myxococcales bacterium]|nr:TetR/AcrR family transcriptional regulator [Myxococcales bacterium]
MVSSTEAPSTDGRLVRGERARAAVVDALLALIEEGDLQPTGPRIAERAGVSLRLVFHHFHDLEDLFAACAARRMERILPTLRFVPADGPLGDRLTAFVGERTRMLEQVAPVRRAALLREPFSLEVATRLEQVRSWKRAEVERVFAQELDADPEGRAEISAALALAASFSAWESLRVHQGLTLDAARAVMRRMIESLVRAQGGLAEKTLPRRKHGIRGS